MNNYSVYPTCQALHNCFLYFSFFNPHRNPSILFFLESATVAK